MGYTWRCSECDGPWLGAGCRKREVCSPRCADGRKVRLQTERRRVQRIRLLTAEDRAKLDGALVVASVSGGKDSAAASLWLTEQGIEHRRVFCDTGWEHPATYEYLRGPLAEKLGAIEWIQGRRQMHDLIRHKGMFPARACVGSVRRN